MPGSLILYLKGMRRMMFQLSGFYYKIFGFRAYGWLSKFGSLLGGPYYSTAPII